MKKVILVILDGCRADMLKKAATPNINKMMAEGIDVKNCYSVFPTITGPAQISILAGAYPEKTGITGHFYWDSKKNKLIDINSLKYCQAETLFEVVKENKKKSLIIGPRVIWFKDSESGWLNKIFRKLANTVVDNQFIMRNRFLFRALEYVRSNNLILSFMRGQDEDIYQKFEDDDYMFFYLVFGEPDRFGHESGPETSQYLRALELCDKKLGELMDFIKKSPDDITMVVTADHGQTTIRHRLSLEDVSLTKVGYKISQISRHPIGKEVRIVSYNQGRENAAVAVFVTRHLQIWLKQKEDAAKIVKFLKEIKGVAKVLTKEQGAALHLEHERLSDITMILDNNYGFDTNNWLGDHGGINSEDLAVPLIIWGKNISVQTVEFAQIIDIAPTVAKILDIRKPKDVQGQSLI